jgi:hypothetical protein
MRNQGIVYFRIPWRNAYSAGVLYASKGVCTLFTGQREKYKERLRGREMKRVRERDRDKESKRGRGREKEGGRE